MMGLFYNSFKPFPYVLLGLLLIIGLIGVTTLYSAGNGWFPWAFPHIIRFIIGLCVLVFVASINLKQVYNASYVIYFFALLLLIAVHMFGMVGLGAKRWLDLWVITIQPSELMKLALILLLARVIHSYGHRKFMMTGIALVSIIAPFMLIFAEPDFGTAFMVLVVGTVILFCVEISIWYFAITFLLSLIFFPIAWVYFLKSYQKMRILTFLGIHNDPLGAGYHELQSKILLGSGGFFGHGFSQGSRAYVYFLPEKQTDFSFTLFGGEFGFLGVTILLSIFLILSISILIIALQTKVIYLRMIAIGVSVLLFLYVAINIGMVVGILPVVGVPLPMISYGGTAMIMIMASVGLIINIRAHGNYILE